MARRDSRPITQQDSPLPIPALQVQAVAKSTHDKVANPTLARAVSLHLDGQLTAALAELKTAIDAGNRQPALFSAIGHILCELREFEQASKYYSKLLELEPEHRTANFNRAVCLAKMSEWEKA